MGRMIATEGIDMAQWRCTICGYMHEGQTPPERCPVCSAGAEAFERVKKDISSHDTQQRFVIVGSGAAGFAAAKAIRARNKTGSIHLISGEERIAYSRPSLSAFVGGRQTEESMTLADYDFYIESRIIPIAYARVERVDREKKEVVMEDGFRFGYDKLLLATGANAFNPVKSAEDAIPVSSLRHIEDARFILKHAPGKRVLIVGGGILGIEAAVSLKAQECEITILDRGDRIIKAQADARASELLEEKLRAAGIGIEYGLSVDTADARGALLTDGSHRQADFILVSAGVRSETGLARDAGLAVDRAIVVDDRMRTGDEDIYAAGDCAEFDGKPGGLWTTAMAQGEVAGAQMAGDDSVRYVPPVISTFFSGLGARLFSAGRYPEGDLGKEIVEREGVYRKLFFEGDVLIGAVFFGDTSKMAEVIRGIGAGVTKEEALQWL